MRTAKLLAPVLLAMVLAGCGRQAGAPTYDLSAEANQRFLADNAKKQGVVSLPDGLQYRVITAGHGPKVEHPNDVVTVTYKGWTIDGHVFDRTEHGQTASFQTNQLIPGWEEALQMMRVGDEWQIVVPADLGYGAEGSPPAIAPNQTLVFTMQVLAVHPADVQP